MFGWLVGWFISGLVDCLAGWLMLGYPIRAPPPSPANQHLTSIQLTPDPPFCLLHPQPLSRPLPTPFCYPHPLTNPCNHHHRRPRRTWWGSSRTRTSAPSTPSASPSWSVSHPQAPSQPCHAGPALMSMSLPCPEKHSPASLALSCPQSQALPWPCLACPCLAKPALSLARPPRAQHSAD